MDARLFWTKSKKKWRQYKCEIQGRLSRLVTEDLMDDS